MSKNKITLTLDADVYFKVKSKDDFNASKFVNTILKEKFMEIENEDINKIIEDINNNEKEKEKIENKLIHLYVQLQAIKDKKKENEKNQMNINQTMKNTMQVMLRDQQ